MGRVLVLGSINTDLVVRVERLPRPGETVPGDHFAVYGGGKGANQAIAAARAGAPVAIIGCLGDDRFGADRLAELQREGVDIAGLRRLTGVASGVALIGVDGAGQNCIMLAAGANGRVSVVQAGSLKAQADDLLLAQLELPLSVVAAGLAAARQAGALTVLNAAPLHPATSDLLSSVDLLIINELEAADLLGAPVTAASGPALAALAARGPQRIVVTLGDEGVIAWDQGRLLQLPALPVTPVDTTGAGDAFCGVLAASLVAGADFDQALRRGIVAGGLAVTRQGAQSSLPQRAEIDEALQ
jgi:ribokinase